MGALVNSLHLVSFASLSDDRCFVTYWTKERVSSKHSLGRHTEIFTSKDNVFPNDNRTLDDCSPNKRFPKKLDNAIANYPTFIRLPA